MSDRYLLRQRIIDQLLAQMPSKVVLINAPPGCGKTTAMRQLTEQLNEVVCWHQITKFETDLSVFMQGLALTLALEFPEIKTIIKNIDNPELIIHEITTYLRSLNERVTLVLDDLQIVTSHPNVVSWLDTFIEVLPTNVQIIIITQVIPQEINITKLYAKDNLVALYQQQLWFTAEEVQELAHFMDSDANPYDIWFKLQGWVAGTAVALRTSVERLDQTVSTSAPHEVIFNDIAAQLLSKQPPHIQQDLMKIALLDALKPRLIEQALSIDWFDLQQYLKDNNLFLIDGASSDVALYSLFRKYLQQTYKTSFPQEYLDTQKQIAKWYLVEGTLDSAFEHFIEAEQGTEAAKIADNIALTYYVQGRFTTLQQFNQKLSLTESQSGQLDFIVSQILADEGDIEQAETLAQQAVTYFKQQKQFSDMLKAEYQLNMLYLKKGEYHDAIHGITHILAHPHVDVTVKINAYHGLGKVYTVLGDYENALMYLETAKGIVDVHSGNFGKAQILQDMEFIYRTIGRVEEANIVLQQAIALYRELDNTDALAFALNNAAYRLYENGEYPAALDLYHEVIALPQHEVMRRTKYYLYASMGDIYRDLDHKSAALHYYNQALQLVGHDEPSVRVEILTHLSIHHRWHYQFDIAQTYSQMALGIAKPLNLYPYYDIAQVSTLAIKFEPWNFNYIQQNLEIIKTKLKDKPNHLLELHLLSLEIRMQLQRGETQRMRASLREIENKLDKGVSVQVFLTEVLHDDDLEKYLYQHAREFPQIADALNCLRDNMYDTAGELQSEKVSEPVVKFFVLGADVIKRDDEYVSTAEWGSSYAREILWYLLFNGATARDTLLNEFWGDVDEEAAIQRFHFSLARIRKVLGQDFVKYDFDTAVYAINSDIDIWCDALELKRLEREIKQISYSHPTALSKLQQAAQLAQGQFLPGYYSEWINDQESKFERLYLKIWTQLGDCCYHLNRLNEAISAYRFASKLDPYYEEPYRGLMKSYHTMGERAIMSRVYQDLISVLKDMGISPSPQTSALYTQLLQ